MESKLSRISQFLQNRLELRGDTRLLGDEDSLFLTGRLDSLDAMHLVVFLEEQFQVDFAEIDFSLELIDRPRDVLALADHQMPR